jgi:amino acid transporter
MGLANWLLGRPLATAESEEHKITVWGGIPILGLDALSSAAYGPEAALTVLLPLGAMGLTYAAPIVGLILALLTILYFSYRQTMHAYPSGGGSYIVAKSNLGTTAGLFAAAALLLDYVLTVAVGISAGVGALISAIPSLHEHILGLCMGVLVLVTIVNLRGVKDAGVVFFVPTYLFIVSLLGVIVYGIFQSVTHSGHPQPVQSAAAMPTATMGVGIWLLLRAFASGCTAMTGVEAVSNGIQAFAEPRVKYAQKTLAAIVIILGLLLAGIAYLSGAYHIGATDPNSPAYQSVISQLVSAIAGRGVIYYVTLFSVIAVLALSANTGFADFPRLCHLIAEDEFLPHFFAVRGRRLVFSAGILILALMCAALLIAFGGITDRLIPLFAIGAFLAFTLSQAGMVAHWWKIREKGWKVSLGINGLGAICTGITLVVVMAAKFTEGAWITVLLIPLLVLMFYWIRKHYHRVDAETAYDRPINLAGLKPPLVLVPIKNWDSISEPAIRFAMTICSDVLAIHVVDEEDESGELKEHWEKFVAGPIEKTGRPVPKLKIVHSPYRRFIQPILDNVRELREANPNRVIAVVVPELVKSNWFHYPLHNQRANILKAVLLFSGGKDVVVINVPWYLDRDEE